LAINIYGITYGIKNADGILPGGSDMVNVSKDLSREPSLLQPTFEVAQRVVVRGSRWV
jgi:hypothetical protein